ncbi:MAG: hypothetical protein HZA20_03665 [Nitrospirae bacterium]|nr:hypothetical protein [Nitrospirota bacterium]
MFFRGVIMRHLPDGQSNSEGSARILEIHARIRALKGLVDRGAVLKIYGVETHHVETHYYASLQTLEMPALVEETLRAAAQNAQGGQNEE